MTFKTILILAMTALFFLPAKAEEYARIQNSDKTVVEYKTTVGPITFDAHTAQAVFYWVPIVRNSQPAFDPATQKLVQTETVTTTEVTYDWQVVALTQEELDAQARTAARIASVTEIKSLLAKLENQTATNADIIRVLELLAKYLEFDEP